MLLVAVGWIYVVLMLALVEVFSPGGTLLGAFMTLVFWGVLPLSIVLYVMATPTRKRLRAAREAAAAAAAASSATGDAANRGEHASGDAVATIGKEP